MARKSLESIILDEVNSKQMTEIVPLLLIMMSSTGNKNYEVLANLTTFLDSDTLVTLLKVFGGTTITFPSLHDYRLNLLAMMVIYEKDLQNLEVSNTLQSLDEEERKRVQSRYERLSKQKKFQRFIARLKENEKRR